MRENLNKKSAAGHSGRIDPPSSLNPKQEIRAQKLAARDASFLLSTKNRVRGLAMVPGFDRPKARIAPAIEFPPLEMPKPKPANLNGLMIEEAVLVDGVKYTVNRLTYRNGKCIAELRDRRGERLWVGEGQLFELRRAVGPYSFRIRRFERLHRPEREAEYV